ncbi:MAG: Hpt domain-containing protein [Thiomargarita sp.]|nr:Hpt domain-containing protein [Thiomargarita sp.]
MQLLDIPKQIDSSEIDEEILEIFLEEVEEVLQEIITNLHIWNNNPAHADALQNLRRAFHTLKGSGRLVGATVIGELGWRFEDLSNRLIEGTLKKNDEISLLIGDIETELPNMIEQYKDNLPPPEEVIRLISHAYIVAGAS